MKKVIYVVLIFSSLLMINGCVNKKDKQTTNSSGFVERCYGIKNNGLIEINKAIKDLKLKLSMSNNEIVVKDKEKIDEIANYINSLDLTVIESKTDSKKAEELVVGNWYEVNILFSDGTNKKFSFSPSNTFHEGETVYHIPYNQSQQIVSIYSNLAVK